MRRDKGGARDSFFLAPVVAVAVPVAAIAIIAVGSAVPTFVGFAVGLLVVAVIAHPVFVAMRVFPLVIFEMEVGAAVE